MYKYNISFYPHWTSVYSNCHLALR
jgi:hypothetical protein